MIKRVVLLFKNMFLKNKFLKSNGFYFGKCLTVVGGKHIQLGSNFSAGNFFVIQAWDSYNNSSLQNNPSIIIGNNVSFMSNCQISAINRIEIGDNCLFGDNVFITDNFHGNNDNIGELKIKPLDRPLFSKGPVVVGNNVWIGRNVCIMPGVTIGDGCIVGANSVVTKSFEANTVIAGVPAEIIKEISK